MTFNTLLSWVCSEQAVSQWVVCCYCWYAAGWGLLISAITGAKSMLQTPAPQNTRERRMLVRNSQETGISKDYLEAPDCINVQK